MKRKTLAAVALMLLAGQARAQSSGSDDSGGGKGWGFYGRQKFVAGNQKYRDSDTMLELDMPHGLNLSVDANVYRSETSSATPTVTFGGGVNQAQWSLGATYANTGLANDSRSHALDVSVSANTDSKDFRTTVGADVNVVYDVLYIRNPKVTNEIDITERTPTISLKQQVHKTKLTCDLSQTNYNKNIQNISASISRLKNSNRYGGLSGLIQGFPDYSVKYGVYQDVGERPVTVWGTYENIRLLDTTQVIHGTGDSTMVGMDMRTGDYLTLTLQFNHLRQTSQPVSNQFGLIFALSF